MAQRGHCQGLPSANVTKNQKVETSVQWRFLVRAAGLLTMACASFSAQSEPRALLVGVSVYPHLPGKSLQGPANDLRLMRQAFQRLGVPDARIVELSEAAGPALLPTRAHILQALQTLAQDSRPGDLAIVYLSGHGTQAPQSPATRRAHPEADGLDEVFLPRDTLRWRPDLGVIEGGIVDDEFGAAFDKIRAQGAQVWAIFDTCHAGDMTRSPGPADTEAPIWRHVAAQELGVRWSAPAWRPQSRRLLGRPAADTARRGRPADGGLVAFFAALPDEAAAEEIFADPDQPQARRRFGVFTYYLHQALRRWSGNFAELAQDVERAYVYRPFPQPNFEGDLTLQPQSLPRPGAWARQVAP
jgi:hypothetical protein